MSNPLPQLQGLFFQSQGSQDQESRAEREGGAPRDPLVEVLLPVPLAFYSSGLETLVPGGGKLP